MSDAASTAFRSGLGADASGQAIVATLSIGTLDIESFLDAATRAIDEDRREAARAWIIQAAELVRARQPSTAGAAREMTHRGGLAPWQKRRVVAHVDAHLASSIKIEDLADLVSLSSSHFRRAFKESFGVAPHTYIVERRVEMAKDRIATTRDKLSEVALDCGFADQAHLSKLFRRLVGETPNAWRRARLAA